MEFYPGFKTKYRQKRKMSDSITKLEDMEPAQSYTGLGEWIMTTTNNMTKNIDVKPSFNKDQKTLFRDLVEKFNIWNDCWIRYEENYRQEEKPMNADEFAEFLSTKYEIEEL